ncbi:MAG: M56 family metallopeptidase [Lachnospiraceae bacterium]|nr:M56 family metallopeptidase [Lachnospiraceae bacterium]
MTDLFLRVLNMSIAAGWMVAIILLVRIILQNAPKWTMVFLWGIVALRLLCPITIESEISLIPSDVYHGEVLSEWLDDYVGNVAFYYEESPDYEAAVNAGREPIPDSSGVYYVVTSLDQWGEPPTVENTVVPVLTILWLAGVAVLVFYMGISYWKLDKRLATAVRYRDHIFQSENVESPFVLGLVRPRIYLPYHTEEMDLNYVIAHEQAHILRKDHWWKLLGYLLRSVHWFNPLIWLAYRLLCRDIELACDEKVIRDLSQLQRADYTQALVSCSVSRRSIATCPLAFGEVGVKERIQSVMNYKKPGRWGILIAVIVCLGAACCLLTSPRQDEATIRIVVPAGSDAPFVYSEEEISPLRDYILVSTKSMTPNQRMVLKPMEVTQERAYEPFFGVHGWDIPLKIGAEKGGWFKFGVEVQNPTDRDIIVEVKVEYVEVRIADGVEPAPK